MPDEPPRHRRRWRFYRTAGGNEPVRDFILQLAIGDQQAIAAAMKDVERNGMAVARHLRGDIYEVRAMGAGRGFRVLFSAEGQHRQVLLALEAFSKKTQKTPLHALALAESRLTDWRQRRARP